MDNLKRLEELQRRPESEWVDADGNHIEDHDRGLLYDVGTLLSRRRAFGLLGGLGAAAALAACSTDSGTTSSGGSTAGAAPTGGPGGSGGPGAPPSGGGGGGEAQGDGVDNSGVLTETPDETNGPYPADGSNGPDVLTQSGVVRTDIRSSFGSSTTTAEGIPLTFTLVIRDAKTGTAKSKAAVYVWHCDREGLYSLYSEGVTDQNYLRGVAETDANGNVTFTSIFPACYTGRWPHIHFEVYDSLATATASGDIVKTSQLAFPKEACDAVYATDGYSQSVTNMSRLSLATDNVFGNDGGIHQLATMTGDVSSGYTATLTVGV